MKFIVAFFLLITASTARATDITITCNALHKDGQGSFIIDPISERMKHDCNNCDWMETLYWGDDYILTVNPKNNRSFGRNMFYHGSLYALNRNSMLMMMASISDDDFRLHGIDDKYVSTGSTARCVRGF